MIVLAGTAQKVSVFTRPMPDRQLGGPDKHLSTQGPNT
jgi:hypothetical protein